MAAGAPGLKSAHRATRTAGRAMAKAGAEERGWAIVPSSLRSWTEPTTGFNFASRTMWCRRTALPLQYGGRQGTCSALSGVAVAVRCAARGPCAPAAGGGGVRAQGVNGVRYDRTASVPCFLCRCFCGGVCSCRVRRAARSRASLRSDTQGPLGAVCVQRMRWRTCRGG